MKVEQFDKIVEEQLKRSTNVLVKKAGEYATEDRLHNFKVAAELYGERPQQALAGMMAKHTVSIYDMCKNKKVYPIDMWNEKITDHINYLLLLRAIVEEEKEESDLDAFILSSSFVDVYSPDNIRDLNRYLENRYYDIARCSSRSAVWSQALHDDVIPLNAYDQARKYYGISWNYTGN